MMLRFLALWLLLALPVQADQFSFFNVSLRPTSFGAGGGSQYGLQGVVWNSTVNGNITILRYYVSGGVYNSGTGFIEWCVRTQAAPTVELTTENAISAGFSYPLGGWISYTLQNPIPITPGKNYYVYIIAYTDMFKTPPVFMVYKTPTLNSLQLSRSNNVFATTTTPCVSVGVCTLVPTDGPLIPVGYFVPVDIVLTNTTCAGGLSFSTLVPGNCVNATCSPPQVWSNSTETCVCPPPFTTVGAMCVCNSPYRANIVTPTQCTVVTCPYQAYRNTTTDNCVQCVPGIGGTHVNLVTGVGCAPNGCNFPFVYNATTDLCDACADSDPNDAFGTNTYAGSTCAPVFCPAAGRNIAYTCVQGYYNTPAPMVCLPGYIRRDGRCISDLYQIHPQPETNYTSLLINSNRDCNRYLWIRLSSVTELEINGTILHDMNPRFNLTSCSFLENLDGQQAVTCSFLTSRGFVGGFNIVAGISAIKDPNSVQQYDTDYGVDNAFYGVTVNWPYQSATSRLIYRMLVRSSNPIPAPIPTRKQNASDWDGYRATVTSGAPYTVLHEMTSAITATFGDGRVGTNIDWYSIYGESVSLIGNNSLLFNTSANNDFALFKAALIYPDDSAKAALSASLPPIGARSDIYNPLDMRPILNCTAFVDMTIPGVAFNVTVTRNSTNTTSSSTGMGSSSSSTSSTGPDSSTGVAFSSSTVSPSSTSDSSSSTGQDSSTGLNDSTLVTDPSSTGAGNETFVPPPPVASSSSSSSIWMWGAIGGGGAGLALLGGVAYWWWKQHHYTKVATKAPRKGR